MSRYILSIDQGTTSSRAMLFDRKGRIVSSAQRELAQCFPHPGWVEQSPVEIWTSVVSVIREVLERANVRSIQLAGIGIANQRETTIIWDRRTGKPVYNAVVWQSRQSAKQCEEIGENAALIHQRTGLIVDPYFSGTKIRWILDNIEGARARADKGELLFGTVDSWLIWNLTGGRSHITDVTNASRTLLFDIRSLSWDSELLEMVGVPASMLPVVCPSSGEICVTSKSDLFGAGIPITGIAGDQQAAMFGHACFERGSVKSTYGTGCFVLMNIGDRAVFSEHGMLTTIAWQIDDRVVYALEGSVFIGGAVIQWLRDGLGLIDHATDTQALARGVTSTDGVYVVPAFVGLGAPYWNRDARGAVFGLTRGARREHLVRASLESIAFQVCDVIDAMQADAGFRIGEVRADGGAITNDFLAQFQSDMLGVAVRRPKISETTSLGAAYLAGLGCGFWSSTAEIASDWECERVFVSQVDGEVRRAQRAGWRSAVRAVTEFQADSAVAPTV